MRIINIEHGMPTVDDALVELSHSIATARTQGQNVIKIIHGYGSSGKGGGIKRAIANELKQFKEWGMIVDYVMGENFGTFDPTTQKIYGVCTSIIKDSDYNRKNPGITVVLINRIEYL